MTGIRIAPSGAPLYVGAIPPGIQVSQSGAAASSLLDGLVAYWKLDEASGIRFDSVGTNHLSDNNTVGSAIGKIGNAASFVAANSEYLSSASAALDLTGSYSISLWVRFTSTATSVVIGKFNDAANRGYALRVSSGSIQLRHTVQGVNEGGLIFNQVNTPLTYNDGNWHHVVMQFEVGVGSSLYVDNTLIGTDNTTTAAISSYTQDFRIGAQDFSPQRYYSGDVDEVGIWSRALTVSGISDLYNLGSGITYPF
jgi:hypothetical protein